MAVWGALFLLAVAGITVYADPSELAFPEEARGGARIVSGWEAQKGQFPHQLSIRMVNPSGGVTSCGASIIHSEWAVTAAHCTATRVTIVVRVGTVNLTEPALIFETTKYYNHPLYIEALQSIVQPNDIGLIEFGRKIEFNDVIKPIRIQRSSERNTNYGGTRAIASGWGRTWTNGNSPENLNWVYLSIVTNFDCLVAFGGSFIIQDSTICASGYNVTSQSTCQGDSGGPLTIIDDDGQPTLVGVASFVSSSGCHTDFPAGFIRPGHYHSWFTQVSGIDFDWDWSNVTTTEPPFNVTTTEPPFNVTTTEPPFNVTTTEPPINVTTNQLTPFNQLTSPPPSHHLTSPPLSHHLTSPPPSHHLTSPPPLLNCHPM
ncbi:hypothetical protein HF086_018272 [Spodoptera exigua]|uniref:Peptidase S1 domain-containing protein n=1 Tax=Spodoptera exigua TaxID=7107 RepID=A0A922SNR3_SPOEX|nr:hypothetical protein HF086_018272 [Spodoptera exigua]